MKVRKEKEIERARCKILHEIRVEIRRLIGFPKKIKKKNTGIGVSMVVI